MPEYPGKLADPHVRHDRASKAGRARTTTDYYINQLVETAPPLTAEQRDRLAALLRATPADGGVA